ncbi:MAG: BatA domain-containing protein [Victivallales bacterium]|nr:BatA domain-containing protein [Victivallales bacterium]
MLTFTYPYMLWGLLALAVPIVLHLLNRHNHETLVFPVVKFLFRAQLPHEGRRRLRDFILLMARLLVLAFAVLFLARPHWVPKEETNESPDENLAVFLLDCSASMSGWGHLEREQKLLEKALKELAEEPGKWRVAAVASSDGCMAEEGATTDFSSVSSFANQVKPTHLAGNHRPALQRAVEMLSSGAEKRLYLVSDFGRGDWGGLSKIIPPDIQLRFLSCTVDGRRNVGISNVRTAHLPQGRQRVMVTLRNYSTVTETRTLTVKAGDETVSQEVVLSPFAQQRVALSLSDASSQTVGVASLDGDDYQEDDLFRFALKSPARPKALVIAEEGDEQKARLSSLFTSRAMEAGEDVGGELFDVVVTSPMFLDAQEFRQARAVFVLGCLERLASTDMAILHDIVSDGASLFVTPGGGAASVTLRRLRDANLMTVQCNGMAEASRNASLGIGWVKPDSSIGRLYEEWKEADLFLFPIFKHLRLQPEKPSRTLMKSLDGLPLLVEQDCGAGRSFLFAFDFGTDWSVFALTSSFLPILRELCRSSLPDGYGIRRLFCGGVLHSEAGEKIDTSSPGVIFVDEQPVEVFSSPQEAMTESANVDDLKIALYTKMPAVLEREASEAAIDLWRYAAYVLAVFLLLEAGARCLCDAKAQG